MDAPSYAEALERVSAVYRALDASDGTALARNFSADALWHRPDGTLQGIDAIRTMARERDPARTTAHIVGNLAVEGDERGWIARYYLTVYVGSEGTGGFAVILACEDQLVNTTGEWLVAEKRSEALLRA